MLAFKSERVSEGDPGWTEAWIHEGRFAADGGGTGLVFKIAASKKQPPT